MPTIKKLTFAPLFIIALALLIYRLSPVFKTYDLIFSLSTNTLIQLITLSALISFSSFLFILFSTLALDLKFVLPVAILACLIPFLFLEVSLSVVFAIGILISLLLTFFGLNNSLKSYLNFQPNALLGPFIRHLSGLLILVICIVYFLSINKIIIKDGFQIPDSLIDTALKFSQPQTGGVLETANSLIKQAIKDQLQNLVKPYLGFIPAVLALLLFLTLQSLTSIVNLLVYPLLWLIFYILEKSGFTKFTTEMRPVKKMVI